MDKNDANRVVDFIYRKLYAHYGELKWWPAQSPYEVMVGAVLTQNTAWSNVEKAIGNLGDRLSPEYIEKLDLQDLCTQIRPAGFFNQKAVYLKELTAWYKQYDYSVGIVQQKDQDDLRRELRSLKGIGNETADAILLYAFQFPSFVVDAYTKRLLERFPLHVKLDYFSVQSFFEANIPKSVDQYNQFHALIVIHAKEHCKAKPKCEGCPLEKECRFPVDAL
ncbi:MAG: endonuclease [Oscillospiraceae bacterium]